MLLRFSQIQDTTSFEFDPENYDDCETEQELMEALEEVALEQLCTGAELVSGSSSEVWEALVEHRKQEN